MLWFSMSTKVTIFIKSWARDLKWLSYALRSIECNWETPETEVVLVLDEDCRGRISGSDFNLDLSVFYVKPWPDGYCHAMYVKTMADEFSRGELIVLTDSDCILTGPSDLNDLGAYQPIIPYMSYKEHNEMYSVSPWQRVTERLARQGTQKHYMASTPIMYHRSTFAGMRQWLTRLHGQAYWDLVYSGVEFRPERFGTHPITLIDYDLLGYYADHFEPGFYRVRELKEVQPSKWKQYHSWSQSPEAMEVAKVWNLTIPYF
jgi:hypothetical protein